ncbi:hypothetical protein RUM43_002512 [Polyplax serrata]|uniref:Uncharacterized protein n=1 Tax=Polyplax serrata TaxID=468196 RepID=A0AAN8PE00_POLSC
MNTCKEDVFMFPSNPVDDEDIRTLPNELNGNLVPSIDRKYRHNRLLRRQIIQLEQSSRKIQDRQNQLDRSVRRIEKEIKSKSLVGIGNPRDNEIIDERLVERVGKLEETDRSTLKQIFNVSRQVSELGRLHLSMLQLLESVESLETKVDQNVPDLQREISKMEFNLAQATSSISLAKEDRVRQFYQSDWTSKSELS